MQDSVHWKMFVELIEPSSKQTTNKSHSNENQKILYVP